MSQLKVNSAEFPEKARGQNLKAVLVGSSGLVGVILIWFAVTALKLVPPYRLPDPVTVLTTMVDQFGIIWPDLATTIKGFLFALAMSVVAGLSVGIAIVDSRMVDRAVYPIVVSSQVVPKITVAPIFMIWFGFGLLSAALIGMLIAFFPVVLATITGLRSVQPEKLHLTRAMGAGWASTLFRVRLPSALPYIMPGIKLAVILALLGVLTGEFIGAKGIGNRILRASAAFNTEVVFASSTYAVLLGFAAFGIITLIETRFMGWARPEGRGGLGL